MINRLRKNYEYRPWDVLDWVGIFVVAITVALCVAAIRSATAEPEPPTEIRPLVLPNGEHLWYVETENGDRCTVVERNGKTALECRFKEEE